MKKRYKLLIIIVLGIILTILINKNTVRNKLNLVSIGDGLSLGMTEYKIAGPSFNDYLKEELEKKGKINEFNNEFSQYYLTIHELNEYIEDNQLGKYTRTPIKQVIAKADILTISIGLDELVIKSLNEKIDEYIKNDFLLEYKILLSLIREFYDKKIIILGLYSAYQLNKSDVLEINSKLNILAGNYNCIYYDLFSYSLNNKYLNNNSYYINYEGHKKIANDLIKIIENK